MIDQPRVLIVDDDPNVRLVLERVLKNQGYQLETAVDGEEARAKIANNNFDLLLLDLDLGAVDGLQLLNVARHKDKDVIVIILTAHASLESAVKALRLGAFDYLFKPAMPDVIRQRVRDGLQQREQAQQQRHIQQQIDALRQMLNQLEPSSLQQADTSNRFLHAGDLMIDRHHRAATLNGRLLDLTTTEFDLLVCLAEAAPEPCTAVELMQCALGYDGDEVEARDTIKWYIHHIRRKIEPDSQQPTYIKTIRFKGYLWSSE